MPSPRKSDVSPEEFGSKGIPPGLPGRPSVKKGEIDASSERRTSNRPAVDPKRGSKGSPKPYEME